MHKKILKILLAIVPVILVITAISVTPALATYPPSPSGCTADNSVVNIAKSTSSASVGQTVTFTLDAGNPTSTNGCDIANRMFTLTLPNDTNVSFGPFNYPNPTALTFVGSADYVAKKADLVGGSWVTTVSWTGIQKDGADSASTGSKGVFVTYVPVNLTVVKTAVPAAIQTYNWTIDKNVTPAAWTLFDGDTGTSEYTVAVVKTLSGTADTVSGTITITNPSAFVSAHITGVTDVISPSVGATVNCPVSFPYDLAAGAQLICTYNATLLDSTTRLNNATVSTTGDINGGWGTASVDFTGVTPTVVGGSINVDDTNGGSWTFSDSGSVKYNKTFDCSGLEYDTSGHASYSHVNTATIRGTALHHDATVNVDCYKPSVTKTAVGNFNRIYTWNIQKSGPSSLTLVTGETSSADYTVTVTKSAGTDSNVGVTGTITVHNPATIAAKINSVTDAISGVGAATVNCSVTFPYTLAVGQNLVCTYSAVLPDATSRTNTATATQQNYNYDKAKVATADGTKDYSGTAPVTFGNPTSVTDNCINVSDTLGGSLGSTCASKVFTYSKSVGPFTVCGPQPSINNTASFITSDTHTTGSSSWTVGVNVPCPSDIKVWTVKKIAFICDSGASAPASQNPPEIGGCVDDNFGKDGGTSAVSSGNASDIRYNQYLFTGERLDELVAARDLSGAQFLASTASLYVDNASKVTCIDVSSGVIQNATGTFYSFNGDQVGSLLNVMPPAFGVNDPTGFNKSYDKLYDCVLTVDNSMIGAPSSVYVGVMDTISNSVYTVVQKWYFNPAISISVSFDSGSSITFPTAQAGSTVYSSNTMIIKNTALGGVDLVTYLTGNDLTDTTGHGLCPGSNTLNINQMSYRCLVDSMQSETWTPLSHLKENNGCFHHSASPQPASDIPRQCDVEDNWSPSNLILPDASNSAFSIIANGHMAQCWFQLQVPFPCLGQYSAANAVDVLVRAL